MALFRFISIAHPKPSSQYGSMAKSISYILNNKKTNGGRLTDSINCSVDNALNEMIETKEFYGKISKSSRERLSYHCELSWHPDEKIEYEEAIEIAKEFCNEYFKGYEVVLAAHTDKSHCHVHMIVNSVNQETGYKYQCPDGEMEKVIGPLVDKLCKKHGYKTLFETSGVDWKEVQEDKKKGKNKKTGKSVKKSSRSPYYNEKNEKFTKKDMVKNDFDEIILEVNSIQEFYEMLQKRGYKITRKGYSSKYQEDYFAVFGRGMERAYRNYQLGSEYSMSNLLKRIEMRNKPLPIIPINISCRYIIPYKYWKAPSPNLTEFEKRQYYSLYKKGICPKDYFPSYQEINRALKAIEKTSKEIEMIEEYNIDSIEAAEDLSLTFKEKLQKLEQKKKDFYMDKKPYMHLLNSYKNYKQAEPGYNEYIAGDVSKKEDYEKFLVNKELISKFGFSEFEIIKFKKNLEERLKQINQEIKEARNEYKICNNVRNSMDYSEPDYSEERYNDIPETYYGRKNKNNKKL